MAINFKAFMKDIKDGVKEVRTNRAYVKDSKKKQKKMREKLIDSATKKKFVKENGQVNYNKSQDTGSILNKNQGKYKKMRKGMDKKYSFLK